MVISWKLVGKVICCEVCEIIIFLVLIGCFKIFKILWLNFGSLFKNSMFLCVKVILLGLGCDLLLFIVIDKSVMIRK